MKIAEYFRSGISRLVSGTYPEITGLRLISSRQRVYTTLPQGVDWEKKAREDAQYRLRLVISYAGGKEYELYLSGIKLEDSSGKRFVFDGTLADIVKEDDGSYEQREYAGQLTRDPQREHERPIIADIWATNATLFKDSGGDTVMDWDNTIIEINLKSVRGSK